MNNNSRTELNSFNSVAGDAGGSVAFFKYLSHFVVKLSHLAMPVALFITLVTVSKKNVVALCNKLGIDGRREKVLKRSNPKRPGKNTAVDFF